LTSALLVALVCAIQPWTLAAGQAPVRGENEPSPATQTRQNVAQASPRAPEHVGTARLVVTVDDENGVAVVGARVALSGQQELRKVETDYAGRCEWADLASGVYQVRVEKEGFYAFISDEVRVGEIDTLEVTLNHVREFVEVVNVV
jgi:hypothetical protein